MDVTDVRLKMYLNPRVMRLNEILDILNILCCTFKPENGYNVERRYIVNQCRDIKQLMEYVHLGEYDFAKHIMDNIFVNNDKVDEILKDLFLNGDLYLDDYEENEKESAEIPSKISLCLASEDDDSFKPKIFDFQKAEDYMAYANYNAISYDFIVKMQQKMWEGILDEYLKLDLSDCNAYNMISMYVLEKFDMEFVESIVFGPMKDGKSLSYLKKNVQNWALVNGIIGVPDDINVSFDEENNQVLISFEFNI